MNNVNRTTRMNFSRLLMIWASLLIGLSITSVAQAATVNCQANRSDTSNVIYLYYPTAADSNFPDDPAGLGISTSPLEPFDVADLDSGIGTTAQLRNAITERVKNDYCEYSMRVVQTTSANGTTNPVPTDARWAVVGIGSDSGPLFGVAQGVDLDVDELDSDPTSHERVWGGTFKDEFGGSGEALNGADSTLARWANAIAGTISHEVGHDLGIAHEDAAPVATEGDTSSDHVLSSPSGEARAQDRHFSNNSFEILARTIGLYEQTVSNWDFINPNDSAADGFRITILVRTTDGTPTKGSMYTGGLSPWNDVSIDDDGTEDFQDNSYNRFIITFTSPKSWNNGSSGEIPAGEDFHVGVGLTTDYIVRNVEFTDGGTPMPIRPRVVGYTTGGSFNPATGDFHVTFSNADPENGPLILSDFVVRYLPRTVDINEMITGGELIGFDGLPIEPWDVRGADRETFELDDKVNVNVGKLTEKRAVDFIAQPSKRCGLITPPPIQDAIPPSRIEYCRKGHVLGLFPSARIYIEATLTDPNARYFDRDRGEFVVGPLKSRIFAQLSGVTPDLNKNGVDDAIDISKGDCTDRNSNGVCDEAEPNANGSDDILELIKKCCEALQFKLWLIIIMLVLIAVLLLMIFITARRCCRDK